MACDPMLAYGEMAVVSDCPDYDGDRIKIGDGRQTFSQLPWFEDFTKVSIDDKGVPKGVIPLGPDGRVPPGYLPDGSLATYILHKPVQQDILTYNGGEQTPVFDFFDSSELILSGSLLGVDAGSYRALMKPQPGYVWADGTATTRIITWVIAPAVVDPPQLVGDFDYDGEEHTAEWTGFDESIMTVSGDLSAVDAGEYEVTFVVDDNHTFKEGF